MKIFNLLAITKVYAQGKKVNKKANQLNKKEQEKRIKSTF